MDPEGHGTHAACSQKVHQSAHDEATANAPKCRRCRGAGL